MSDTDSIAPYSRLAGVYDELVVDPCHGQWAAWLDELWAGEVTAVLDVCCGTGLLAAELCALGYRVVGVDASAAMLERARRLLPEARFVQATLPDLGVDGTFDAAVCTFDGLNYLSPADLRATLAALAERAPRLVFDVHTDAMMAFTLAQPVVSGEQDGRRFTIVSEVDAETRECATSIELEDFSELHHQWFHSEEDLRAALAHAGFRVEAVTDEYTNTPAGAHTLRATWVARR